MAPGPTAGFQEFAYEMPQRKATFLLRGPKYRESVRIHQAL